MNYAELCKYSVTDKSRQSINLDIYYISGSLVHNIIWQSLIILVNTWICTCIRTVTFRTQSMQCHVCVYVCLYICDHHLAIYKLLKMFIQQTKDSINADFQPIDFVRLRPTLLTTSIYVAIRRWQLGLRHFYIFFCWMTKRNVA